MASQIDRAKQAQGYQSPLDRDRCQVCVQFKPWVMNNGIAMPSTCGYGRFYAQNMGICKHFARKGVDHA